jgi:hypothetical protein
VVSLSNVVSQRNLLAASTGASPKASDLQASVISVFGLDLSSDTI